MELIRGVALLRPRVYTDARGDLVALERFADLPFAPERVFFMKVDAPDAVRGGHANSCDELIVALTGSVLAKVDNGSERTCARLRDHDQALWVRAGALIRLRSFASGTTLLVCASARSGQTRHFARPQPHLIGADCPV